MKQNIKQHVHKLKRHRYTNGTTMYFCVLDCSFKISPALSLGKRTICWRCDKEFIMDEYSIRLAKPHCQQCHKPKNATESYDIETPINHEIIRAPIPLPVEPLSGERTDTIASLKSRLTNILHSKAAEGDEDI